jgi:hypothetical protein
VQDVANRESDEYRQITPASQCILQKKKKNDVSRDENIERLQRRHSTVAHGLRQWLQALVKERRSSQISNAIAHATSEASHTVA